MLVDRADSRASDCQLGIGSRRSLATAIRLNLNA